MKKTLLIAWQEFSKHALRKRFIGALLAPLLMLLLIGVIIFVTVNVLSQRDRGTIGVVESAQVVMTAASVVQDGVAFERFTDGESARKALQQEKLTAYYVLASDFVVTGNAELFYWRTEPSSEVRDAFRSLAEHALLRDKSPQIAQRYVAGSDFTFETADGSRKFGENNVAGFLLPLGLGIMFLIALMSGSQYLMQAVVDEKENRTMEVIITSVTPMQLMTGKVIGLGSLGLFQVVVWLLALVVALAVAGPRLPFLREITLEPGFVVVAIVMFILNYLLLGAIMAAVGAAVIDAKQAQTFASPFVLIAISPEFFIPVILFDPNGAIAITLSLFPLTSPLAMVLRYGLTAIPIWQVALSLVLMALSAWGAFWLAGRIFRAGMLHLGQRLSLAELASSIRI